MSLLLGDGGILYPKLSKYLLLLFKKLFSFADLKIEINDLKFLHEEESLEGFTRDKKYSSASLFRLSLFDASEFPFVSSRIREMIGNVAHLTSEYLSELNIRRQVSFISGVCGRICRPAEIMNLCRNCSKSTLVDRSFLMENNQCLIDWKGQLR